MCGISGFIDTSLSSESAEKLLSRMLEISHHRGPDYTGKWHDGPVHLGHNRLSILDLSDASNQPMDYMGCRIIFNGEIYNFIEIRAELQKEGYRFSTSGDTEVILAAYRHWGEDCVQHFIGMWAFAIWDEAKQILFCSRDRFGIKPFHYLFQNGRFYFSSEIKSLKPSPVFSNNINLAQVARGLNMGWMHYQDETYFEAVKALPAAHNLTYENGNIRIRRYFDIDFSRRNTASFNEKAEQFRELFFSAIKLHERRDVTLGVCLSGGLDSSAIASTLSKVSEGAELKTFSAYFTGEGTVDERPFIAEVLRQYPNIVPHYISPSQEQVAGEFERIQHHMDLPMPSSSYIAQYFVMKLAAANDIKVLLDGQGSDEIMGGYMHSFYRLLADDLSGGHIGRLVATMRAHAGRQGFGMKKVLDILGKSLLTKVRSENELYHFEFRHAYPQILKNTGGDSLFRLDEKPATRLNQFLYNLIYVTLLPTLLHTEDVNAMAFSIESRVPFLDHRLVEFCFALDNEDKIHQAETKYIMRQGLKGILPDAIANRKDKKGFVTPGEVIWLRGSLRHLLDGDFHELKDIIDVEELKGLRSRFLNGENKNALFLWRLAMLRSWIRTV